MLRKAVDSLLQLTSANGEFIPFNDAMKEKAFESPERVLRGGDFYYIPSDVVHVDVFSPMRAEFLPKS